MGSRGPALTVTAVVPGKTAPGVIDLMACLSPQDKTQRINLREFAIVEEGTPSRPMDRKMWMEINRDLADSFIAPQPRDGLLCLVDWLVIVRGRQSYR